MFNLHDSNERDPPTALNGAIAVSGANTSGRRKGGGTMDVYEIGTEKIVNLLGQGVVPWHRP